MARVKTKRNFSLQRFQSARVFCGLSEFLESHMQHCSIFLPSCGYSDAEIFCPVIVTTTLIDNLTACLRRSLSLRVIAIRAHIVMSLQGQCYEHKPYGCLMASNVSGLLK
jgi:hypothetical protein